MREFEFTRDDFNRLRSLSTEYSGIKVPDDKFDMFYCRLAKRLRILKLVDFKAYCRYLKTHHDEEFTEFINAITTNLTSFFRENHHFEYLRDKVIPDLKRKKSPNDPIRVWSAGCSTGEEPYSIAMTLMEAGIHPESWNIRILATDLDTQVLTTARTGIYLADRLEGLSTERLKNWFQRSKAQQANRVRINPEVGAMVTFKQLNLITPWQLKGPFDVIFCRNVLIYFDQATKASIVNRFAELLPPAQHLFIGHSESLHNLSTHYENIGHTIYCRTTEPH